MEIQNIPVFLVLIEIGDEFRDIGSWHRFLG